MNTDLIRFPIRRALCWVTTRHRLPDGVYGLCRCGMTCTYRIEP